MNQEVSFDFSEDSYLIKYDRRLIYFSSDVEVVESDTLRSLHFGSPVKQSEILIEAPHLPTMEYLEGMLAALCFQHHPKSALFVGLGAGTLPHFLHIMRPDCQINAVEISKEVCDVAQTYFFLPKSPKIKLIQAEGCAYLTTCEETYDIIFIDIYGSEGLSNHLQSELLEAMLSRHVNMGSVIAINLWSENFDHRLRLHQAFETSTSTALIRYKVKSSKNEVYFIMPKRILKQSPQNATQAAQALSDMGLINFSQIIREIEIRNNITLLPA